MDKILGGMALFIWIVILISVILGLPLMLLWNWLMPVIFGLGKIGFWQAVGLNFLSSILFKSTSNSSSKN